MMDKFLIVALDGLSGTWGELESRLRGRFPNASTAQMRLGTLAASIRANVPIIALVSPQTAAPAVATRKQFGVPFRIVVLAPIDSGIRTLIECIDQGVDAIAPVHRMDRIVRCIAQISRPLEPNQESDGRKRFVLLVEKDAARSVSFRLALNLPENFRVIGAADLEEAIWQLAQCHSELSALIVGRPHQREIIEVAKHLTPAAWLFTSEIKPVKEQYPYVDFSLSDAALAKDLVRLLPFLSCRPPVTSP